MAIAKWIKATGGTITTDGDYKIHTFTGSGTFTVTTLGLIGTVEYLVIGGGGGGGNGHAGGGGGAGTVNATGGDGGSGVVIVAYTTSEGNHTGGDDTGTDGDYTWVKFTSSGTLTLSSPSSIKSINGLAKASIKSRNGLAIGSIKSINGLS